MRRRRKTRGPACALLVVLFVLAGCGDDPQPSLKRSDLPPRLARKVPALKQAGFEVEAMAVGDKAVPVIAVDADEPILLAATSKEVEPGNFWLPPRVSAFGQDFTPSVELYCGRFVAAGPDGVARNPALNATGICRGRDRGGA